MSRRLGAALCCGLLAIGSAQLASRADDEPIPVDILVILGRTQGGMGASDADMDRLREYATRHANDDVDGIKFDEVVAICKKTRESHERPSAQEIDRLRAWANAIKARAVQIQKDAGKQGPTVPVPAPTAGRPAETVPRQPNAILSWKVDILATDEIVKERTEHEAGRRFTSLTKNHFEAGFPATIRVGSGDDFKLDWDDGDATLCARTVTGAMRLETHSKDVVADKGGTTTYTTELSGTIPIHVGSGLAHGSMTSGSIEIPKGSKRPYWRATAMCPGASTGIAKHEHTHSSAKGVQDTDRVSEGPVAAVPTGQLTMDDSAPESPFCVALSAPAQYRPMILNGLPKENVEAGSNARCTFDAAKFKASYASGKPYKESFDYSYVLTKVTDGREGHEKRVVEVKVRVDFVSFPPEYEALLVPVDAKAYDEWIPDGPPPPRRSGVGNSIAFRVALIDRKTRKEVQDVAFRTKFSLRDVSRLPGVCVNYPQENKGGIAAEDLEFSKPDLRFAQEANPDATILDDGMTIFTADGKGRDPVHVSSYDWGAYGKIEAEVQLDGHAFPAVVAGPNLPEGETLSIPRDDNGNHVADAWERQKGIYDLHLSADYDEDRNLDGDAQRRTGDGYTLHEEYRGFVELVGGLPVHTRTDPRWKDCFVYDPDGLHATYYKKNPARLVWHYVDQTMFRYVEGSDQEQMNDPNHRWVNTNSDESHASGAFHARQYLVHVLERWIDESGAGEATFFDQLRSDLHLKAIPGFEPFAVEPLKNVLHCLISEKLIIDAYSSYDGADLAGKGKPIYLAVMETTVCHEVGHAIGISHHRVEGQRKPSGKGEQISMDGVEDCAMRYTTKEQDRNAEYMKVPHWRYCKKGEKYKGEDGQTHSSDDCYDQVDVKSD